MELEYDRSLYGKEHVAGPFEVTKKQVQAFTQSIGESNPVFLDEAAAREAGFRGLAAPPTFCTVLVARFNLPDINLKFGRMQAHAGERVQPRAPIVVGDQLTASSRLKDVYAKTGRSGAMVFISWETTFWNQNGEVVAEIAQSFAGGNDLQSTAAHWTVNPLTPTRSTPGGFIPPLGQEYAGT